VEGEEGILNSFYIFLDIFEENQLKSEEDNGIPVDAQRLSSL
jgi:hypothetical protein